MDYNLPDCHPECDETHHEECEVPSFENKYWQWYFGAEITRAKTAREDLGLPSYASETEVMERARSLK